MDGKALGYYSCQDMSFLIFWSAFAAAVTYSQTLLSPVLIMWDKRVPNLQV